MPAHGAHRSTGVYHRRSSLADNVGARLPVDVLRERCHQLPYVCDDLHDLGVDETLENECSLLLHRILGGYNGKRLRQSSPFSAEITPLHQTFLLGEVVHDDLHEVAAP